MSKPYDFSGHIRMERVSARPAQIQIRMVFCDSSYTLTTGNVDYLPGYGYISGTALNGTGIPGVFVTTNTSNSTTSEPSGFYYFFVPAGSYNLTATKEPVFYQNSPVIVTAISGTTVVQDIELTQKPTGTINGTVTSV